jgi:CBS domain-containing protein
LNVSHIMNRAVVSIDSDASVKDAATKMAQHRIGCLIVTEKGRPVGMITETDMLSRVVALAKNAKLTKVKTVMSKPLICGSPDMDFIEATRLMVNRAIKKLPITHGEKLVGILTITDAIAVHPVMHNFIKEEAKGNIPSRFLKRLRKRS